MSSKNPTHTPRHGKNAERATWLLTIFTGILAIFTAALAVASFLTVREQRRAATQQLSVQTWLYVEQRADADKLNLARKTLAQQLDPYDPKKRAEMDDDILGFFETVGALYNRNLLNKELAASSFSFEATRWWEVAKAYIADERRTAHDQDLYGDFEEFAKAMQKDKPPLSESDLKDFLAGEKALETE